MKRRPATYGFLGIAALTAALLPVSACGPSPTTATSSSPPSLQLSFTTHVTAGTEVRRCLYLAIDRDDMLLRASGEITCTFEP